MNQGIVAYLTHDLITHLIVFQSFALLILLSNIRLLHQARKHAPLPVFPTVSILVPARNEAHNIARCVQSLLAQDYPAFEVIVLDDQSEDDTAEILGAIAAAQPCLQVIRGVPPPAGQVGKNWACSQLARQAKGELLFFTDADTLHAPSTLRALVTALSGERADLITGFPRQEVHTWGERLLVPFFSWALLCFAPLALAYRVRRPALAIAVGQVMLFRREAYLAIGGHEHISRKIVDDLSLAARIQTAGRRWRVIYCADLISCRMYHRSRDAVDGFTKNLFAAFGFRVLPFLFVFTWLALMFWQPLVVLALRAAGQAPLAGLAGVEICIGLSVLLWSIPYAAIGVPLWLALLYPLTALANLLVALESLRRSLAGRLSWKGRGIQRAPWRWV